MKAALSLLAALLLLGCVPGLQSAKPPTQGEPPLAPQGQSEPSEPSKRCRLSSLITISRGKWPMRNAFA